MKTHLELTDKEFTTAFKNCTLPPTIFSHEAHIRLAWIHICKYGAKKAEETIQKDLKRYVINAGATDKYNVTLTVAAVKAVAHFMKKATAINFSDFITEFPKLKYNFKDLMAAHYEFDIYNSPEAKANYISPNKLPF